MKNKKKAAAIAVAAVLACGTLAGCDALTTVDSIKDYRQVIAEVDISASAEFEADGEFAGLKEFIEPSQVTKQELIMSFLSNYSYLQQMGGSIDIGYYLDMIAKSLASYQIRVQYAKAYVAKEENLKVSDYQLKVAGIADETAREVAALSFFLSEDEIAKAEYDLRVSVNDTLDSIEESYIKATETHDHTADSDVRTLPTGAETENEDYFAPQSEYKIYTGAASSRSSGYEELENSTSTTRKKAYNQYLANLRANNFLKEGEKTGDYEATSYFMTQKKSALESALIEKVNDITETEYVKKLNQDWAEKTFNETVNAQKEKFSSDKDEFESAFGEISESSFVFSPYDSDYGYVINILLPFSTAQSDELTNATSDLNDPKGNKFAQRAALLDRVKATDQRGTWFTGHEDYSYVSESGYGYENGREYLFFEDSFGGSGKSDIIKNYYGNYTYNGTVVKPEEGSDEGYTITPNEIGIDGFLEEMDGYLNSVDGLKSTYSKNANYNTGSYYDDDGNVDYAKFIYAEGQVTGDRAFNADEMFVAGTWENKAFSVINELSFAYNTDTAGLNTYLGYMISPYQTNFMKEFEYAAQDVVSKGAGHFNVVPTDYGWHIIYCTFSFADFKGSDAFHFDYALTKGGANESEDSFSYLYFEQLKSAAVSAYTSNRDTEVLNTYYDACATIHEDRYSDLH